MSEIIINQNKYHYEASITNPDEPVFVFLHGFLGSKKDFYKLLNDFPKQYLVLDLLGFGENRTSNVKPEAFDQLNQIRELNQIFVHFKLRQINLVGYSMGGRIAIAYALHYPDKLQNLVLESTTAGICDVEQRKTRQRHDQQLAKKMLNNGMESFVDQWEKLPLFASQKNQDPDKFFFMHQQRVQQNPRNAANSLIKMGTGQQPNYWGQLDQLQNLAVLIVVGSEDAKFVDIGKRMQQRISHSQLKVITGVGHNIHFERPDIFKNLLLNIA